MAWFKRTIKGILTPTSQKRDIPASDKLWYKTSKGKILYTKELAENAYVSPEDGYHVRIGSQEYFRLLFDGGEYIEQAQQVHSVDRLQFVDIKPYTQRLQEAQTKTHLQDAIRVAEGKTTGIPLVIACMDFGFIGGSMGAVVGEKIAHAVDRSLACKCPLLIIAQSGGARMMEGAISLMQMAKTAAKLQQLSEAKLPYLSLLTHPTTGGVTASFAMLGDINLAEPGALIGFAGPRVIRETIKQDLPKGFQKAEFLQEHGFVDKIVDRRNLKATLTSLLRMLQH